MSQPITHKSKTFQDALVDALLATANAPLSEGDQRILHFHLDQAMRIANQKLGENKNDTIPR